MIPIFDWSESMLDRALITQDCWDEQDRFSIVPESKPMSTMPQTFPVMIVLHGQHIHYRKNADGYDVFLLSTAGVIIDQEWTAGKVTDAMDTARDMIRRTRSHHECHPE